MLNFENKPTNQYLESKGVRIYSFSDELVKSRAGQVLAVASDKDEFIAFTNQYDLGEIHGSLGAMIPGRGFIDSKVSENSIEYFVRDGFFSKIERNDELLVTNLNLHSAISIELAMPRYVFVGEVYEIKGTPKLTDKRRNHFSTPEFFQHSAYNYAGVHHKKGSLVLKEKALEKGLYLVTNNHLIDEMERIFHPVREREESKK